MITVKKLSASVMVIILALVSCSEDGRGDGESGCGGAYTGGADCTDPCSGDFVSPVCEDGSWTCPSGGGGCAGFGGSSQTGGAGGAGACGGWYTGGADCTDPCSGQFVGHICEGNQWVCPPGGGCGGVGGQGGSAGSGGA